MKRHSLEGMLGILFRASSRKLGKRINLKCACVRRWWTALSSLGSTVRGFVGVWGESERTGDEIRCSGTRSTERWGTKGTRENQRVIVPPMVEGVKFTGCYTSWGTVTDFHVLSIGTGEIERGRKPILKRCSRLRCRQIRSYFHRRQIGNILAGDDSWIMHQPLGQSLQSLSIPLISIQRSTPRVTHNSGYRPTGVHPLEWAHSWLFWKYPVYLYNIYIYISLLVDRALSLRRIETSVARLIGGSELKRLVSIYCILLNHYTHQLTF